jgi:hypothetical protein
VTNPFNAFVEGLEVVRDGGTILLNGVVADTLSSWTSSVDFPVTLTADPAGPVQIGKIGGGS